MIYTKELTHSDKKSICSVLNYELASKQGFCHIGRFHAIMSSINGTIPQVLIRGDDSQIACEIIKQAMELYPSEKDKQYVYCQKTMHEFEFTQKTIAEWIKAL